MGATFPAMNAPAASLIARLRSYLTRGYLKELAAGTFLGLIGAAVAVGLTSLFLLASQNHLAATPSKALLSADWNRLRGEMIARGERRYPDRRSAAAFLRQADPGITVIAPDYQALKRAEGASAYVAAVSPSSISLVGRAGGKAIVTLDASLSDPKMAVSYRGHIDLSLWARLCELWGLGALVFGLFYGTRTELKIHRRWRRERQAELAEWRRLVPDSRYGPLEPEAGFYVLEAERRQDGDRSDFWARWVFFRRYSYYRSQYNSSSQGWQMDYGRDLPSELDFSVVQGSQEQLDAQWQRFCSSVAEHNAQAWAEVCAERHWDELADLPLAPIGSRSRPSSFA